MPLYQNLLKPTSTKRAIFFLIGDILLSLFSLYLAYLFRFNFHIPEIFWLNFWKIFLLLVSSKILFLSLFGLYNFPWRFFGLFEAKRLLLAITLAYLGVGILLWIDYKNFIPFPRSAIIIDYFLSIVLLGFFRALKRILLESGKVAPLKTAAIYGLTNKTKNLVDAYNKGELDYKIVAIIDENKTASSLGGIPIFAPKEFDKPCDLLIFAKELEPKELSRLIDHYKKRGVKEFQQAALTTTYTKKVEIEDLLARKPKDLDTTRIANFIQGKKILITGAGGSIGSELVRQAKRYGASSIVAVEMSEYNLYRLGEEHPDILPILADVTEKEEFQKVVRHHKPQIILHAAAYKHVPLAELNPKATIKNNVLGTKVAIDTAIEEGVEHFVLISTDKAVNPTNIMGASKRVCELYAQNVPNCNTTISAVRFGNVLGSSGSVIPKFKAQILSGGPVTVTHPEIRRYFMLTSEACQLVLQAASLAKDQEIFILDMGEPVKIVDLAKKMMELYGKEVPIEFIGLRPGEKLYEEILIEGAESPTKYESIYIAKATKRDFAKLLEQIERLLKAEDEEIVSILKQIVPEFNHQPHR